MLWSMAMNGTHHKPSRTKVTADKTSREILPILVPTQKGESHDGVANFYLIKEGSLSRSGPKVRLLRNADISEQAIRKAISPADYELLTATLDLKKSCDTNDHLLAERAYPKLTPLLPPRPSDLKILAYGGWANVDVAKLATAPMEAARLVLWFASGKFIPAIYCPDLRTAIFVRAFLGLQTCPHCGILFLPEKENVIYCRPAHGHAHRMARSRYMRIRKSRKGKREQVLAVGKKEARSR